jgi:hypothetical protein
MDLLCMDCIFYKVYVVDADTAAADKVIVHITEVQNELLKRVNATEGKEVKGRIKAYYKKLNTDFGKQVNAIGKEIAALG